VQILSRDIYGDAGRLKHGKVICRKVSGSRPFIYHRYLENYKVKDKPVVRYDLLSLLPTVMQS